MAELDAVIQKKILQMKALLGDVASKQVLDAAEAREAAAKEAGVDFKGDAPEEDIPLNLSDVLAQIEAGVADGSIVNDVDPDEPEDSGDEEGEPEPAEIKQADEEMPMDAKKKKKMRAMMESKEARDGTIALKELADFVGEIVDTRLSQFRKENAALYIPRTKEAERQFTELQKSLKETQERETALKAQIDELIAPQPRRMKFRASQAEETTLKEGDAKLNQTPKADPVNDFLTDFMLGGNGQGGY